jgi:actin-related protein
MSNKPRNQQLYSGDETGGLVVDIGSHSSKFGFAGEDCPRLTRRTRGAFAKEIVAGLDELCAGRDRGEHPIIMTVPAAISDKEKVAQIATVFEVGAPAVFAVRSPVACAFAVGKPSALVVEVGASSTTACPVYEGYALLKSTRTSEKCGGASLSRAIEGLTKASIPAPEASASWTKRQQYLDRMDDIKHSCFFIRKDGAGKDIDPDAPKDEYALPDGKILRFGAKRHDFCEPLFASEGGIGAIVYDALAACDPDLRRPFAQDIIVVGGGSLLNGLAERLGADLANRLPLSFKPKVSAPGTSTERRFAPFVGCSVLASLGSFQQLWLSKKEWEEQGEKLALDRFAN